MEDGVKYEDTAGTCGNHEMDLNLKLRLINLEKVWDEKLSKWTNISKKRIQIDSYYAIPK